MTPKYKHDCDQCVYLGTWLEHDVYRCDEPPTGPTYIARFGDDGPDYSSAPACVIESWSVHPEWPHRMIAMAMGMAASLNHQAEMTDDSQE